MEILPEVGVRTLHPCKKNYFFAALLMDPLQEVHSGAAQEVGGAFHPFEVLPTQILYTEVHGGRT